LNENEHNKKELVDQIKDLELQFQLHVSESKSKSEDQFEEIVILKAARKAQEGKLQIVLNEMEVLKAKNRDQAARIEQLEKILKIKSDTTKPNIDAGLAIIPNRVIGSLGINTLVGGIYFYAQMRNTFRETGRRVPFDRILVNKGNGLSPSNQGVFTAPRAGIYHFTFKGYNWGEGLSALHPKRLVIEMHHNGIVVGGTSTLVGLLHVHATLKLKAGDRVYIFKSSGGDLYTDLRTPDTHFSGWLMEEDVLII